MRLAKALWVGATVTALLSSTDARADDGTNALVLLYGVSTVGGIVSGTGTAVALGFDSPTSLRSWGGASVVFGTGNAVWSTLFFIYGAQPCDPRSWLGCTTQHIATGMGLFNLAIATFDIAEAIVAFVRASAISKAGLGRMRVSPLAWPGTTRGVSLSATF